MRSSRLLLAICAALCLVVALPDIAPAQPVHEQPPELGRRHAERHPPRAPVSSDLTEPTVLLGAHGDRVVTDQRTAPVAPGVELTSFEWVDQAGWIQGDVLTVDLSETRTNAGLLFPGAVAATAPLSQMAAEQGAIAGVNGDFFDINATGAPLGAAIADTTPLKGAIEGRELSTGVDVNGIGRIAQVLLEGTITLPDGKVALAGLNQHRLPADGIGAFTPLWGEASRARAVEGATTTHEVTVTGYDETFAPVPAKVRWQVRPGLHRRSFPLRYPATVTWSGDGVVVGAGADAERGARRTTRRCVGIRALRARPSTHRPWAYASPVW